MRKFAYVIVLTIAFFLESTLTTLPLLFLALLLCYVTKKDSILFPLAFLFGLFIDITMVRSLGYSSLFFVVFLFIIFSYERKFEVQSTSFIFFASLLGSAGYIFLLSDKDVVLHALLTASLTTILFAVIKRSRISG